MTPDKPQAASRTAFIERDTKETTIQVALNLDGGEIPFLPSDHKFPGFPGQASEHHASQESASQQIWVWTGIGFLDHMLHVVAKHGGWSLRLRTLGDLAIDDHHTAEDTFLALGSAFNKALGDRKGLTRFGYALVPHDEALARTVIDLSNRPFFVGDLGFKGLKIGDLSTQMISHCLQSFSQTAGITLHVDVSRGKNDHHRAEAAFKSLAVATKQAITRVAGQEGQVISTREVL